MKQTAADKKNNSKELKKRVQQHLADKNDIITEEDIKNIRIGEDAFKDEAAATLQSAKETKSDNDLAKALEERKTTSPWNVLSSDDK